jgi:hypothetical protein
MRMKWDDVVDGGMITLHSRQVALLPGHWRADIAKLSLLKL